MTTQTARADALQLIAGAWTRGADEAENIDPSSGESIGRVARGTREDVDRAVEAAAAGAAAWATTPAGERARVLTDGAAALSARSEQWALQMAAEMGKPLTEARLECQRAAAIFRFFAEELHRPVGEHFLSDVGDTWLFTRREPIGVVGLITPWNFPAAIPAWKLAPALAFGNTVVLKLASDAPATGLALVMALVEAGLPDGVLNVVLGSGPELGGRLIEHPEVVAISFTGSEQVGVGVVAAAAARGKRVQAEMGGHNPVIVAADANLDLAVPAILAGGFASAGQKCTATRRVFADASLCDELAGRLVGGAEALRIGDARDPDTTLGPLVGHPQRDAVLDAVCRAAGAGNTPYGRRGGR
jgi:aldehyde dehydrogenase (NAD+)